MKKKVLLFLFAFGIMLSGVCAGNEKNKAVLQAYELRMNGKVDVAKAIIDSVLKQDSTNAMAWYELARIKHYMFVGGGSAQIEEILTAISKAVFYDPSNVTYAYYSAVAGFLNAYFEMQTGKSGVDYRIAETCKQFKKVLQLKPDYYEAMLYLVEIYRVLPKELGGDSAQAAIYAYKLSTLNQFYGDKALAILAPDGTDMVNYWQKLLEKNRQLPSYIIETSKACMLVDDIKSAENYYSEVIGTDPLYNTLILDLARFHILKVMKNPLLAKDELPAAKTYLERYLQTQPEPAVPFKAYALGLLARVEMVLGNAADSDKHTAEAKALDKYFSRASGIPNLILFDSPDKISQHYFSFFIPY
jgi:Tfp pilus assembly protein PilF